MTLIEGTRYFVNNEEIIVVKCRCCKELWEQFEIQDSKPSGSMWKSCRSCRKTTMTIEQIRNRNVEYNRRYRYKLKSNEF